MRTALIPSEGSACKDPVISLQAPPLRGPITFHTDPWRPSLQHIDTEGINHIQTGALSAQ